MSCPKCGAALKDDYGMQPCPGCQAIVFIDMEGVARVGDDNPPAQDETPAHAAPEPASHVEEAPSFPDSLAEMPGGQFMEPTPDPVAEEVPHLGPEPQEMAAAPEAEPSHEAPPVETASEEFNMDQMLGYQEPAAPVEPDDEAVDISDFANSEASLAKDGLLLFRVFIGGPKLGIDSKEMREQVREAIEDARFGWDVNQVMSRINKGVLRLDDLSPVKATIIVSRLKRLPLEITWEQYLVTQAE